MTTVTGPLTVGSLVESLRGFPDDAEVLVAYEVGEGTGTAVAVATRVGPELLRGGAVVMGTTQR